MNHEDTDMFSHLNDLKSRRSMWLKAPKTCRGVLAPRTCRGVLAPKTCRGVLWLKTGNSLKRKHLKHALNGCILPIRTCVVIASKKSKGLQATHGMCLPAREDNCQTLN